MNMIVTAVPTAVAVATSTAVLPADAKGIAPLGGSSWPDLEARFRAIVVSWKRRRDIDRADVAEIEAEVLAATGIRFDEAPEPDREKEGGGDYWRTRREIIGAHCAHFPCDEGGCDIEWNNINDELFDVIDEILERPATSLADLALQAQAAAVSNSEFWDGDADDLAAGGEKELRQLVDSLCQFAGVEAIPMALAPPAVPIENHQHSSDELIREQLTAPAA